MTKFRITTSSYFGDEATLATADREGLRMFISALESARDNGESTFFSGEFLYRIEQKRGAASLELDGEITTFRLDDAKISEMVDLTEALIDSDVAGHQYVDIDRPTPTLVIAIDESK